MLLRALPFLLLPAGLFGQALVPTFIAPLIPPLHETSGLLVVDGQVWTHGDSGNPNSLYRVDPNTGDILREVVLSNAPNVDWEEVTTDGTWVFVGDIGNNLGSRTDLRIFRFPLAVLLDDGVSAVVADTIRFAYADQTDFTPANQATNWDCEAFIAKNDSLFLFTKNWADQRCYSYVLPATPGDHMALRRDTLEAMGLITGAAYDAGNEVLALIGYTNLLMPFVWRLTDYPGNSFFSGQTIRYTIQLPFTQTEAIAWQTSDTVYFSNESGLFGSAGLWSLYIDGGTQLLERDQLLGLRLSPNPASDKTRILGLEGPVHVRVINEVGAEMWRGRVAGDGVLVVDGFAQGYYTLEVAGERGTSALRLVVVR